jgi:hypothetical protein
MREGRADVTLAPLALFVLGAARDAQITDIFSKDLHYDVFDTIEMKGFYSGAFAYGRPGFLENTQAVAVLTKQHDRKGGYFSSPRYTATKFIKMLRTLRAALAVLAERPIMVDTGLYKDVLRPRTYSDTQAEIGNFLANQPNFQARVKLLSGEHIIRTHPAPPLLPEREVQARITAIKERMRRCGITTPYREVEAEIRERQEKLRERPHSDAPPPSSTTSRPPRRLRQNQKPPPAFS